MDITYRVLLRHNCKFSLDKCRQYVDVSDLLKQATSQLHTKIYQLFEDEGLSENLIHIKLVSRYLTLSEVVCQFQIYMYGISFLEGDQSVDSFFKYVEYYLNEFIHCEIVEYEIGIDEDSI